MTKSSKKTRSLKKDYLKAVMAGLFFSSFGVAQAQSEATDTAKTKKQEAKVHCYGLNECAGKGACHTANNACQGKNSCKGKGWTLKTEAECKAAGGQVKAEAKKTDV